MRSALERAALRLPMMMITPVDTPPAARAGSALPVWVAFTLEDSPAQRLRGGEGVADAAAWAASQPEVQAVLLNCCAPEAISAALPALKAAVKGREGAALTLPHMLWTCWLDGMVVSNARLICHAQEAAEREHELHLG